MCFSTAFIGWLKHKIALWSVALTNKIKITIQLDHYYAVLLILLVLFMSTSSGSSVYVLVVV